MIPFAGRPVRLAVVGAALLLWSAAPGCAGRDRYYASTPESGVSRVAQRPAYGPRGEKQVFVGGYAGADYSRAARGR
jgi:hypothetical protein